MTLDRRPPDNPHPDTVLVDALTAFLNRDGSPSGADAVNLMTELIAASGRPLLDSTPWALHTEVTTDRFGLATATVTAGPYRIRVHQPTAVDAAADLHIAITTGNGHTPAPAITVNGRPAPGPLPARR
jgi:hypothetical protein